MKKNFLITSYKYVFPADEWKAKPGRRELDMLRFVFGHIKPITYETRRRLKRHGNAHHIYEMLKDRRRKTPYVVPRVPAEGLAVTVTDAKVTNKAMIQSDGPKRTYSPNDVQVLST